MAVQMTEIKSNTQKVCSANIRQEEVDLTDIFRALWQGKFIIIIVSAIFSSFSVYYALKQPDIYKASVVLMPTNSSGQGGLGKLAGQFGGLASFAGLSLGGSVDKTGLALEILNSRAFIEGYIERHDILAPLTASIEWDKITDTLIYDSNLYNPETKIWNDDSPNISRPTPWRAYKQFQGIMNVSQDQDTGIVRIEIEHYSPSIAKRWLSLLVQDINWTVKENDKKEAKDSISYLTRQLEKTKLMDMKSIFYQLIEEQTKTVMLAEVSDEYVFKTIDPSNVPDEKAKPKRALIAIFGTLFGGMISILIVLCRFFLKKTDE